MRQSEGMTILTQAILIKGELHVREDLTVEGWWEQAHTLGEE